MHESNLVVRPGESINFHHNFLSLYNLEPLQRESLVKKLNLTKGTCQVWIHTHHKTDNSFDPKYLARRDKLIGNSLNSEMPVIAFIPYNGDFVDLEDQIRSYRMRYESAVGNAGPTKTIYYVPTFENDPLPCTYQTSMKQNLESGMPTENETIVEEWQHLSEILKGLGVKQAILSGAFVGNKIGDPTGCVYEARDQLRKLGFKAFISNVVAPFTD